MMVAETKVSYESALEGLGFKGKVLKDLCVMVQSEGDIEELEAFVVSHDELTTNLAILREYRKYKQSQQRKMSQSEFSTSYALSISLIEKQKCLEYLTKGHIDKRWIDMLDSKLSTGDTTLDDFYQAFIANPNANIRRMINDAVGITLGLDW